MNSWIGVDLDGTIAHYDGWVAPDHIGKPVKLMVDRVKGWLSQGIEVKIFTARVSSEGEEAAVARMAIEAWCVEHVGQLLEVTCKKDFGMIQLWDDRCVQVIPNEGRYLAERTVEKRS